jgi:hypothetical protein
MTISVRLDKNTETYLNETSRLLNATKSKIIKLSLVKYCSIILGEIKKNPYDLIKDLINKEGSGKGDLSIKAEEILRKTFRRKY